MIPLTATYRVQLRNGITFDDVAHDVKVLAKWGFSHLYLSPIFSARAGSIHGYDVTDVTQIDPVLGGDAGFEKLCQAAHRNNMGIIIDIVPNHTAFSVENPWLYDVLRHGQTSRYSDHFDIDWSQRLVLPWLAEPFAKLLEQGRVHSDGERFYADNLAVPLAHRGPIDDIAALHDAQPWQLTHWVHERDGITHRRFFNVTDLIGMRVEHRHVFDAMHSKVFDLIDRGLVQGLRVDHIDGLSDPAQYIKRLKTRILDTPIWVEKILTGDEVLPNWGIAGTTGYEAATQIARVLTHRDGHADLLQCWHDSTGAEPNFHAAVLSAKHQVLREELAAELDQLISLARAASDGLGYEFGYEATREAVVALLIEFPRYRTYFSANKVLRDDIELMRNTADRAATNVRNRDVIDLLTGFLVEPSSDEEENFRIRYQQVTGALIAKSHEDTAGFRQSAYLAACEVGADPDTATITTSDFAQWCGARSPTGLTLTSSHDTKRSEDARMRLVGLSHHPDCAQQLYDFAQTMNPDQSVLARDIWYLVQSSIAIFDLSDPDITDRLSDHLVKALREGKDVSNWTHPDQEAENRVIAVAKQLLANWQTKAPAPLQSILTTGNFLSLAQVALKFTMPGVPDVYQGCLGASFTLTDPDNRRAVSLPDPEVIKSGEGLSQAKLKLTRQLLEARRQHPTLFTSALPQMTLSKGHFRLDIKASDATLSIVIERDPLCATIHWI